MLYVVYINSQETWRSDSGVCLLASFLLREAAYSYALSHPLRGHITVAEVDDVWDSWMTIKDKLEESL